jgi:hypothetical protein
MRPLDDLLDAKGSFGPGAAARVGELLETLRRTRLRKPADLIALHEAALYFRAYPHNARVLRLADALLQDFASRLTRLDRSPFEDPEVSGIAGTAVSTNFSYDFARDLVHRHGRALRIDWDNYRHPERLGAVLARLSTDSAQDAPGARSLGGPLSAGPRARRLALPGAAEDWTVEPHVDWRSWWETVRGGLPWLIDRIDPGTYDLLEIPLVWDLESTSAARTLTRLPRREVFYHHGPLLRRRDVSLESEFAGPRIVTERLTRARAARIFAVIQTTSAVRYRELWGFSHPDLDHFYRADFGRGVDFYFFGVPREWRLPLRAYHGGMYFKNGVPLGYFEGLSLFERLESGFNLYPTFREGETAWLYVRTLKLFREQFGIRVVSIDPYQLGKGNEEAIASGAFWFYRKLGFRPAAADVVRLMEKEEAKIAGQAGYRTPPATLRRLSRRPLFYGPADDWAHFSTHELALRWKAHSPDVQRAKNAPEESTYLRRLQRDPRQRQAMLRQGIPTPDS